MKVAIIGRTGMGLLLESNVLKNRFVKKIDTTPYGKPSVDLILGQVNNEDVVILERFGPQFDKSFHAINHRANMWALKAEGCTHIIAVANSDSLYPHIKVGDFVIIDDFLDFTHNRKCTFYDGEPGHMQGRCNIQLTPYGSFNEELRKVLIESAEELNLRLHKKGTAVVMEGPQYANRGETEMFRKWGGHVTNHIILPEIVLAKECAMVYACVALITTECDSEKTKFHESIMQFNKAVPIMREFVQVAISKIVKQDWSPILNGLKNNLSNSIATTSYTVVP